MNKKKIKIILIVLVLLITISPIIYGYVKIKKELKQLYNDTEVAIQKRTKEITSNNFNEYFKVKSLEYSIDKTYYTFKGKYGIEINFYLDVKVKEETYLSLERAYDTLLFDIFSIIKNEYKHPFRYCRNYKNTLYINGEQVYTQTNGSWYKEEMKDVGYRTDGISWEYVNDKFILKRFTFLTLCLWVPELIIGSCIYICIGSHELPSVFRNSIPCFCHSSSNINICCYRSFERRGRIHIFTNIVSFDL